MINRSITEAADVLGTDPWSAFFDLVQAGGVSVNPQSMNEEQKWLALEAEYVMIDTDASPVNPETTDSSHPRAFGAFPRVIAKYVREDSVLSLEDAVRRMSSMAAQRLGLHDRGFVAPGMVADLVVFDAETVMDRATFQEPHQYPVGIEWVLVNGTVTVADGAYLDVRAGNVLKRGRN